MAKHHRVFIAFAIEDEWARDHLVGQMRNQRSPFEWTDMSVKNPWSEDWKAKCLSRIRGCDGMIAVITKNTPNASGQLWEIRTAVAIGLPLMPMYATQDNRPSDLPLPLNRLRIEDWTWDNINWFLGRL